MGTKVRIVLHGTREGFERLLKADKEALSKVLGHEIISIEEVKKEEGNESNDQVFVGQL